MTKKRIVILHNIISPHVNPLFELINKKFDLTVLYCAKTEENRSWKEKPVGFKYQVLQGRSFKIKGRDLFTYFLKTDVFKELRSIKPEVVVVSGWDQLAYYLAYLYCKKNKIKFVVWSGSTQYEKSFKRWLTKPLVKMLIKGADNFIAYGSRARKYLISLGAKPEKIYISFNTTDLESYEKNSLKYQQNKEQIKEELNLKDKKVIFYYGQLIDRKGLRFLINAYALAKKQNTHLSLIICGEGREREKLDTMIKRQKIGDVLLRKDPGDEGVSKFFAISDLFILPSKEEVWGLVVNEAMAIGLPVIVTERVGSSADMVKTGSNGYVVPYGDIKQLSSRMLQILSSDNLRKKMSLYSKKIISKFLPGKTVIEFIKAIEN